ncbi:hypothetical protein PFICI_05045 [Pestalotiopsis fici W106-1]|uniref:Damage-inducible protein DinB n=1 Tax=Pestalotiopsis fici (strain W106-1 / CGMCC3.15140) TaxID=1229662 RepID=W3XAV6_PESFW|nr:uncharacterized protein PFICI_05045 [Pestalotiopsis fici W106-1]ETS83169.1 hypothetical protein PFICI_05045 [Pestalotiopsis fici W106-1]
MLTTETATMMAKYDDWADQVLFDAISKLPEDAAYAPRKTLFGTMLATLNHNLQVDLIWRAHILGEEHGFSTRRDLLHSSFSDLVHAQSQMNQWLVDWAKDQTPESFSKPTKFNFVSGKAAEMTVGSMLLHIINHKTYHRGWVSQMFFDHDVNPPETDLCVFLCEN